MQRRPPLRDDGAQVKAQGSLLSAPTRRRRLENAGCAVRRRPETWPLLSKDDWLLITASDSLCLKSQPRDRLKRVKKMSKETQQHDSESVADDSMADSSVVPTPTDGESTTNADATAPNSSAAIQPISSLELLSQDQSLAVAEYVRNFTSPSFSRTNNSVPEIDIKALMLGESDVGMSCMAPRVSAPDLCPDALTGHDG